MQKETFTPTLPVPNTQFSAQTNDYDIIVFSHLRWDFVFQRPQHLLSRLAQNNRILIVEEPIGFDAHEKNTVQVEKKDGITILKPKVDNIDAIGEVLITYLNSPTVPVAWFYSGAFTPVLQYIKAEKIVYDCMDELTLFKGADPSLIKQEELLIQKANILFTGGKSLYEAKKQRHANVHCFPSSVDKKHFSQAAADLAIPADMNLSGPIVGYYGVIDERIDIQLLQNVAEKLPYVSFVMIGPVVKIDEGSLPRAANIHYLGMKNYSELPQYLAHFDIAMMPFALNDSTRFISPTKTLEFMAAGKPIISTPIYDVERDYSECVSIIDSAAKFAESVENILNASDEQEASRVSQYHSILNATSWDATVAKMNFLINSI